MENHDAIVGRILIRREVVTAAIRAGIGLAAISVARGNSAASSPGLYPNAHLVASPELTEGPFFVDEHLKRNVPSVRWR
jgi:hypothetical protein